MKIIVCVDLKDGMMFNNRRQSRDAKVYENIRHYIKDKNLWINEYSTELFNGISQNINICENILIEASAEDYCFIENVDILNVDVEELVIYRWDKVYPADKKLTLNYSKMKLKGQLEFQGKSHDKIIREVYVNEEI